jgi:hypothetical protein
VNPPRLRSKRSLTLVVALAGAIALSAVIAARLTLDVTRGLRVEYFTDDARHTPTSPALALVTPEVSREQIERDWSGRVPEAFSVRWFGYLTVIRGGLYTFATRSDDGSVLWVDGTLVIDNGGVHGASTQTGRIELAAGPHFILVEHFQAGGDHEMSWSWSRDGRELEPVPAWLLSTGRSGTRTIVAARVLDWAAGVIVAVLLVIALGAAILRGRKSVGAVAARFPKAASFLICAALAVLHTWPLAANPGQLSRNDNSDTVLNEWIMAWVVHQAPRDPVHLFDANIFYPNRDTLAYSEPLLVQAILAAPVLWLGGSPVLAYNLVLIAGFALTGWTTSLVVTKWTGQFSAGLIAGALAGVNAHTLTRLPHIQAQHAEFLPLAIFALDRLLRDPSIRHALSLGAWFTLQAVTSIYLLVFTAFAMIASAVARPEAWLGRRRWRAAACVALAAAVAGIALLPVVLPYWRAYSEQGLTRSLRDAAMYSARWSDYLLTPARYPRAIWGDRFDGGTALFPGVVGLALTVVAIVTGAAFRDARARMCLAIGLMGLALSFGTRLPGYATLYELVPLLHSIRAPVRIGYLVIVSVALLSGFGMVELRRRAPERFWPVAAGVILVLATAERLAAPLALSPAGPVPGIYDQLRAGTRAVVVELPFPDPRAVFHNARFMMHSTRHWKPMLNGYSGFLPKSYLQHYDELRRFPNAAAIRALEAQGVTHVFVHLNHYGPSMEADLSAIAALRLIAKEGPIALYELTTITQGAGGS